MKNIWVISDARFTSVDEIAISSKVNSTTYVKPKTPEELGFNVDTQGIYAMCETKWVEAMKAAYYETGKALLQFGVGDSPKGTMRDRMRSLSSSKDLEEQKFFVDAIPNPGYRDHELHPIICQTFAYQVSERSDKREVFATVIDEAIAAMFIKTGNFEPVREWLSKEIRKCASLLNKNHAKMGVDLRDIQKTVLKKILKTIRKNGIGSNIIAELAPRLGKTILFLMTAKALREEFDHQAMFVLAYGVGLSVKASYQEEIAKFIEFEDFVYIDNADDDPQAQYETAIATGKFPVVFVSLNAKTGDEETPERLDWIGTRSENVIALLEETDFGVHTDSQVEKTQKMFANMTVTQINSSGTNIGRIAKASGDNPADEIIRVPYCMVEQDGSIPNIVKRKFYNMVFNAKMNGLLERFDENVLPNIKKILADANTQEQFITALFQDLYGYQPIYGMNINRQANEVIKHTMLFVNITKKQMENLAEVIEKACPQHKVLILNGDYTSNKEAQGRTFEELVALENAKYGERDKLIVMTDMMGTRSYSVPQIQSCLFMMEGGDVYPYMQRYSRCLTPGFDKEYGHIFDFAFDTNKTRNTEMSIAIEAAAIMEQKGISFPDAVREVMFSVNIKDMMQGKWLDANDVIARFEDNDKLVEVADALSRVGVEDFNDVDFPFLAELAKRSMSKKEKSDFEKKIKTGKTYETKKREGIDTTPEEDKEYLKALKDMKKTIERAIRMLNSSASTVTEFANYQGKTYEQCLDIIEKDAKLAREFFEMFGVNVSFVKSIKSKLPLPTLDLIVERTIHGDSANNVANSSLGIVADDPALWREIFSTRAMRRKLNSNKCKRILVVAGGLGTEINVLVELYGIDIVDKIVYNDKYTSFCNRIKKSYPQLTVKQGDFLELEFDMKFDVVVGNPPYKAMEKSGDSTYWAFFTEKANTLLKNKGVLGFIIPHGYLSPTNDIRSNKTSILRDILYKGKVFLNIDPNLGKRYFPGIGQVFTYFIFENSEQSNTIEVSVDSKNINQIQKLQFFPVVRNEVSINIYEKIQSKKTSYEFKAKRKTFSYTNVTETQTETNKYRLMNGSSNHINKDVFDSKPCPYQKNKKICVPYNGTKFIVVIDRGNIGISNVNFALVDSLTTKELDSLESIYSGKITTWFLNQKYTQYNEAAILNNFRLPPLNKIWTNEELYAYFGLTQEEIDYIEADVK